MGVVIEICIKYPGGRTRNRGTDMRGVCTGGGIMYNIYQPPSFEVEPGATWDLRRRTGIMPFKDPHTRIKPLALASGHDRHITVTPERTLACVRWGDGRYI
jgi:hypothetical protein